MIEIGDRLELIKEQFGRNYFSHVDPSFSKLEGGWRDLSDMVKRLDESLDHPRHRLSFEEKAELVEGLQESILEFIADSHPSSKFPIDSKFRQSAAKFWEDLIQELRWVVHQGLVETLRQGDTGEKESTFVFKTFELVEGKGCLFESRRALR